MTINVLTNDEIEKYQEELNKHKYQCKHCGRKVVITANVDKQLCSWCNNYVFKNSKDEFKYRMKEQLVKSKNKEVRI